MDNNIREFERWFEQAKFDSDAAEDSLKAGNYEWACFQAQQSGEKALKSFLFLKGKRGILTHSVDRLIKECIRVERSFNQLSETKELDQYYVPTRYPNGLPDQIPHRFYNKKDAEKCVSYARKILKLIQRLSKR